MLKFLQVGGATMRNGLSNLMSRLMPNMSMKNLEIFRIIYNTKKPFGNGLTYVASYTLFWLKFSQVFIYPRYCFKSIPHSISYCLFVISYTMEVVKIVQNRDIVAVIATVANSRQKVSV